MSQDRYRPRMWETSPLDSPTYMSNAKAALLAVQNRGRAALGLPPLTEPEVPTQTEQDEAFKAICVTIAGAWKNATVTVYEPADTPVIVKARDE